KRVEAYGRPGYDAGKEKPVSIELSSEQLQATPIRIIDPETKEEFVVVRADIYDRLARVLDPDVLATGEHVDRIMAEDDANDPYLRKLSATEARTAMTRRGDVIIG